MEEEIICNRWKDLADECRLEPNARSFLQPVGWAVTRISSPGGVPGILELLGFHGGILGGYLHVTPVTHGHNMKSRVTGGYPPKSSQNPGTQGLMTVIHFSSFLLVDHCQPLRAVCR